MGFKRNVENIITDLRYRAAEMNNAYNDGWVQWSAKQDLYRVKFEVEQLLNSSPKFSGEDQWLREQEQLRIINILKEK